jgi:hypothetical protein
MLGVAFGLEAIGTGLQVVGGLNAMSAQKEEAAASKGITQLEMQADQQRRQAMELSAQRSSLEVTRNAQRARSMGTESAVVGGSQLGSGLAGGLSQIQGQATTNQLGISQNLQIGRNIFDINQNISAARIAESNAKSKEATAAGISGLGSSIFKLGGMGMFGGGGGGGSNG